MSRSSSFCKKCGAFMGFTDLTGFKHQCPPWFFVWCDMVHDRDVPGHKLRAADHEAAAVLWAQTFGEYAREMRVRVSKLGDNGAKWFDVRGEIVMTYQAVETSGPQ